jgi:hypothetical protein
MALFKALSIEEFEVCVCVLGSLWTVVAGKWNWEVTCLICVDISKVVLPQEGDTGQVFKSAFHLQLVNAF